AASGPLAPGSDRWMGRGGSRLLLVRLGAAQLLEVTLGHVARGARQALALDGLAGFTPCLAQHALQLLGLRLALEPLPRDVLDVGDRAGRQRAVRPLVLRFHVADRLALGPRSRRRRRPAAVEGTADRLLRFLALGA